MKTSYRFKEGLLNLNFFPTDNEGVDFSGKVKMGRQECSIHMSKDWNMEKIHPDVLALVIILIAYPFVDKEIEVPIGVSQSFHDSFKKETNKSIYPIDKDLKPRAAPHNAVPGLAYSGGVDSTAALTLLPNNTVCFFLDRILPEKPEKNLKLYNKQSIYNAYEELEKQGRQGYMIKTDLEYVRVPKGFPVELSTTIPALLLSDYIGIDSIATGAIMEHQFIPYHKMTIDRDYSVKWHNIFKSADIALNLVTAGISEVGTMKIVLNSPYRSFNHWCTKGNNSSPCLECDKCFRKKLLEITLLKQNIPDSILDSFFLSAEIRTTLKLLPIPCENVIAYITARYYGNHTIMKSLKKRTRGNVLYTDWMERWYEPSKALIADKYYSYIKNEITKYLDTMNKTDEINMQNWNVIEISQSPFYKKYQQKFISDLIKFKQNYKKKDKGGIDINPYKNHLHSYLKQKMQLLFRKKNHKEDLGVSVIICSNRLNKMNEIFNGFLRQSYSHKELIIILNNNSINLDEYIEKAKEYKNIKVFQLDESLSLGHCFKFALDHTTFDYIAKFDDDDYYGTDYLKQAMEIFNQNDCDVVGKASYYIYFNKSKTLARYGEQKENMFINRVADSSLVFKRKVFEKINIPYIKKAGTFAIIQTQLKKLGIKIYSTDRYNYLVNRYDDLEHHHTWKISDDEYLSYNLVRIIAENIEDFTPYVEKVR